MKEIFPSSVDQRYLRQTAIPGWGEKGQRMIRKGHIGIAGAGGLGSPAALYLAAAGIGRLSIVDYQTVHLSNLNRQILYTTADIGSVKVVQAAVKLNALNPEVRVEVHAEKICDQNVGKLFSECDLVLDCLDNIAARHVLNRFCWEAGIPLLHAGIREYYGQLMLIAPPVPPCLACVLPEEHQADPPPVTGPVAGVLGSMQALEAVKLVADMNPCRPGELRIIDLNRMRIDTLPIRQRRGCPVCGEE